MKPNLSGRESGGQNSAAFTLIELISVGAMLVALMFLLVPVRAGSRTKSQSVRCLDNLRQVMNAMLMYTHDNHDLFPPNMDDGNSIPGYTWCAGLAGPYFAAEFNADLLSDPSRCLITAYLHTNVELFRCTADLRVGVYQGTNASQVGTMVPAARSISMSQAVGTADACFALNCGSHCGAPFLPVVGPWLSGNHVCSYSSWRTYGTTSSMVIPGPASIWVITEEDPWSINDASFGVEMGQPRWLDYPSTLHSRGCVITFGDGHVELRKWVSPRTVPWTQIPAARTVPSNDPDWSWMASRTSALR